MSDPIVFDAAAAELSIMASKLRHLYLADEFPVEAALMERFAGKLEALQRERDAAQAEAARLKEALEKARDMFNRDAEAKKQNLDEWTAEGDVFPLMSADAFASWKAYRVAALVLDGILAPALAPAEAQ